MVDFGPEGKERLEKRREEKRQLFNKKDMKNGIEKAIGKPTLPAEETN